MKNVKNIFRPLRPVKSNAAACQASQLDTVASICRGLAQARQGTGRPADEVFDGLENAVTIR